MQIAAVDFCVAKVVFVFFDWGLVWSMRRDEIVY